MSAFFVLHSSGIGRLCNSFWYVFNGLLHNHVYYPASSYLFPHRPSVLGKHNYMKSVKFYATSYAATCSPVYLIAHSGIFRLHSSPCFLIDHRTWPSLKHNLGGNLHEIFRQPSQRLIISFVWNVCFLAKRVKITKDNKCYQLLF